MDIRVVNALFIFCFCAFRIFALPSKVKIGGIFDTDDERQDIAFRYAVDHINHEKSVLSPPDLQGEAVRLPADDSFHASQRVCQLLETGVAGIFGPQSENTANHVQAICDALGIPHMETRWHYKLTEDAYSINLYPHPSSLGQAYYDILKQLKWKKFVIFYDSNDGLIRVQSLLKENNKSWICTVRMLPEGTDWRIILKEMKNAQHTHFVVDVADNKIATLLKQASQIGIMHQYQHYFFTSLNMHTVDLEDYRYGGTNITVLRLFDPTSKEIQEKLERWQVGEYYKYGRTLDEGLLKMTTEAALIYDAIYLFARALGDLEDSDQIAVTPLYCDSDKTWKHGESLINYMKSYPEIKGNMSARVHGAGHHYQPSLPPPHHVPPYGRSTGFIGNPYDRSSYDSMTSRLDAGGFQNNSFTRKYFPYAQSRLVGLTGPVEFDNNGFRTNFELQIAELDQEKGLTQVGMWTKENKATYTRNYAEESEKTAKTLKNKTLIAMTAIAEPYAMEKKSPHQLKGNDRYEGFCVDLLDEIAKFHGFNYTLLVEPEGKYGSKQKDGTWNGIIRELIDRKVDLGIVDFTITFEREEAIDFTMPFMNLGIGIIIKKPLKSAPELFSFMNPFSVDVWIYMATAYLGVSVLLFILARMSPAEWDCPHPCIDDPDELENSFTLQNSLWFIIGTFLCQGADIAPRAVSTRIVAGIWWFFTLIMISSYTANLAAFLTVTRMESPIESAEDLAKQTKIKYGCKEGGSTHSFFRSSNITTYQKMWAAMESARPSVFPKSNQAGVERVKKSEGKYAFLMESSSIEYTVERNCDLMQVGGLLDSKSYGIALPPGSPYTNFISEAILQLREDGVLHKLNKRWWKGNGGGKCEDEESTSVSKELGLPNVGGVFVVLLGGMGISAIVAICEFIWNARELATDENATFCEELGKEVKFIMKCSGNTKPARKTAPSTPEEPLFTYGSYNGANYNYSPQKKPV